MITNESIVLVDVVFNDFKTIVIITEKKLVVQFGKSTLLSKAFCGTDAAREDKH
tara:strand:+ start:2349 stop:2510 length:162 start_codon:yes stop_codon:yes gene_type:complete